jgi:septum formation protein
LTAIVLASASRSRADMLRHAGIACSIDPAHIDEASVKAAFAAEGAAADDCAEALAELKARRISARHPGALVIGADQMLELDGAWLDKPPDLAQARRHLQALSGKRHRLVCVAVVMRDGERLWHATDAADLWVRPLGDDFIDDYLARVGEAALASVGAYQLEGLGAQLFDRVQGDFFTVLGLPLLPLLRFLREQAVLPA